MRHRKSIRRVAMAGIIAMVVGVLLLMAKTVPVYPAFQKEVGSWEAVQKALPAIQNRPNVEQAGLTVQGYWLLLDGRTVCSSPEGYMVLAEGKPMDADSYSFVAGQAKNERENTDSAGEEYKGVRISLFDWESQEQTPEGCGVTLEFELDGWRYRFDATGQGTPEQLEEKKQQMKEILTEICCEMIDCGLGG